MKNQITVRVRAGSGTYLTGRVGGKYASCTVGPRQAAEALARKLGPEIVVGDVKIISHGVYEAVLGEEEKERV